MPAARQSAKPGAGKPGAGKRGAWVWALLATLMIVWELQAFVQHPRRDHPTLSSLSNELLATPTSRAMGVVAWLALGVWLARR